MNANFSYRKDIDGLRALAILPVLFFHAGLGFSGGYVGVDVFFVISGYLITSIIAREIQAGTFTYRGFWERRIRRIFPASFFVTVVTFLAGLFILLPPEMEASGKAALSQVLMVANFYFWQQDGYFAGPSDLEPFLQMWSLAVEEQFYLVLPLLLTVLLKRGVRKTVIILIGLSVLSFIWSCLTIQKYPAANFFLLPSRAWELLAGSLLAFAPLSKKRQRFVHEILATVGLVMILVPVFLYDKTTIFPGISAVLPCLGTLVLIHFHSTGGSWVKTALSSGLAVWVGKISFSLYLWHWPLLAYVRNLSIDELSFMMRVILLIFSIVLAVCSWKFIEQPFRGKTKFADRSILFRRFFQATFISGIIFTVIYKLDGLPQRFQGNKERFALAAMERAGVPETNLSSGKFPLIRTDSRHRVSPVLLWGDSHASSLISAFAELCEEHEINAQYATRGATPPLLDVNFYPSTLDVAPFNDRVLELIDSQKIETVVLAARWTRYLKQGEQSRKTPLTDRDSDDRHQDVVFEEALKKTVRALRGRNIRVFIVRQVPLQHRSPPAALWIATRFGYDVDKTGVTVTEHLEHQERANEIIDLVSNEVTILDPTSWLHLENGYTRIGMGDEIFYYDPNHLSKAGARFLKPLFRTVFNE